MEKAIILLLSGCLCTGITDAAECEAGWMAFKDETCLKAYSDFLTYAEAKLFCESQGNSVSTATLAMIKEAEMQEFVAEYTKELFDNLWLGGRYNDDSCQFEWEDGQPLTFTNWGEGYPRANPNSETCIQLRPVNAKRTINFNGKWEDTACQRRNVALCQRPLSWSLEDATREILGIRKELQATKESLQATQAELQTTKVKLDETTESLATVNTRVFPIGFIYIEYYNQPNPSTLWPSLRWQDVTSTYAGWFFRAYGGNSSSWGVTQTECAPRTSKTEYTEESVSGTINLTLPATGWSAWFKVGFNYYPLSGAPNGKMSL